MSFQSKINLIFEPLMFLKYQMFEQYYKKCKLIHYTLTTPGRNVQLNDNNVLLHPHLNMSLYDLTHRKTGVSSSASEKVSFAHFPRSQQTTDSLLIWTKLTDSLFISLITLINSESTKLNYFTVCGIQNRSRMIHFKHAIRL